MAWKLYGYRVMKFNPELKEIKTYEAGKPIELVSREYGIDEKDIIKLASNENPYGVSPKVVQAVKKQLNKMYQYPDDSMYELKNSLATKFDLESTNFIIGAGSDQIIEFIIRAKANKNSPILSAKTTFAMYDIYAKQIGSCSIKTPSHQHNLDEFFKMYKQHNNISIIFLCLPNNPLGESLDKDEVFEFISKIDKDTLVVVDGAYQDFASFKDSKKKILPKELIENFSNTLYLGTFSKSYGLGGMRVGYGVANQSIIQTLYKLRPPFNVTTLSLVAAKSALEDEEFVQHTIKNNFKQMKIYEEFAKNNQIDFIDSYTNFITFIFDDQYSSKKIFETLFKKGIIIRDLTSYGINGIRVTIGTKEQNTKFLQEFEKILKA